MRSFLIVFAALAAFTGTARADFDPMVEIGSGVSTGITPDGLKGMDILLRVSFSANEPAHAAQTVPGLGTEEFYLARVTADFSIGSDSDWERLRYMNLRIVPLGTTVMLENQGGHGALGGLDLFPVDISRNVYIDQNLRASVHIVGVRLDQQWQINSKLSLFTDLSAKLLGYRHLAHLDETEGAFNGASIGQISGQTGATIGMGEMVLVLFAGADADLALGSSNSQFSVQSDMDVFGGVALDLTRALQHALSWVLGASVFVKVGHSHTFDTGNSSNEGSNFLMTGFSFKF